MENAGHNSIKTAQGYIHSSEQERVELMLHAEADFWDDANIVNGNQELILEDEAIHTVKDCGSELGYALESPDAFDGIFEYVQYAIGEIKKSPVNKASFPQCNVAGAQATLLAQTSPVSSL